MPPADEGGDAAAPTGEAACWWALRFTPRAAIVDGEALLLDVAASERLWGGRAALLRLLAQAGPQALPSHAGQGPTALLALALLRLARAGRPPPPRLPDGLPLATLTAARPHVQAFARMGCRTWGALAALPRAGVARRFGQPLLDALDEAWGRHATSLPWLVLPERFDVELELPALAESAASLLWGAVRLLAQLRAWLLARQCGVLGLELAWRHDLRRIDGVDIPPWGALELRTAEPTRDVIHLRRLLAERLGHCRLAAPASRLRLRALATGPLAPDSASLLPDSQPQGEALHELLERLGARLGADNVQALELKADHRPEHMQRWVPFDAARHLALLRSQARPAPRAPGAPDGSLLPAWLLRAPARLACAGSRPLWQGQPLQRLAGPHRIDAGWWSDTPAAGCGVAVVREYFVGHAPGCGLVWIYRERLPARYVQWLAETGQPPDDEKRWFLHGIYG
ncbi:MAG: Protein ImuB [Xylophilus sp.]|nr:MAG: Protein ImuB [Xylophilus sp.]